jgi:transcriptional regulator with XRE-family HTH domain
VPSAQPNYLALQRAVAIRREQLGITQDALAEASGLNRRAMMRLQSGERKGTLSAWFALARGLDMRLGELVDHLYDQPNS